MTPTPIRDYDQLINALKARADEIGLSYNLIDELTGLPNGYTGKLFGPSRVKMVGMDSLWLIVEVLAIEVTFAPSLALAQKMAARWERRDELRRRPGIVRKRFSPELKAKVMSEIGRIGGGKRKRFRLSLAERKRINKRNGKKGGRPRKNGSPPLDKLPKSTAANRPGCHAVDTSPAGARRAAVPGPRRSICGSVAGSKARGDAPSICQPA